MAGLTQQISLEIACTIKCQLTITEKMADVHFTRMHCSRKSLKKANRRMLKDRHRAGG